MKHGQKDGHHSKLKISKQSTEPREHKIYLNNEIFQHFLDKLNFEFCECYISKMIRA